MKTHNLIICIIGAAYLIKRAQAQQAAQQAAQPSNGGNFIQSQWDALSGQPAYMFGTVPAPSNSLPYAMQAGGFGLGPQVGHFGGQL